MDNRPMMNAMGERDLFLTPLMTARTIERAMAWRRPILVVDCGVFLDRGICEGIACRQ